MSQHTAHSHPTRGITKRSTRASAAPAAQPAPRVTTVDAEGFDTAITKLRSIAGDLACVQSECMYAGIMYGPDTHEIALGRVLTKVARLSNIMAKTVAIANMLQQLEVGSDE